MGLKKKKTKPVTENPCLYVTGSTFFLLSFLLSFCPLGFGVQGLIFGSLRVEIVRKANATYHMFPTRH